jgi:hypothetical protein
MFYLNWKSQLDILTDKELRRFINNLISWHQDESVELKTKTDLLVWNGVIPALKVNDDKWNSRADKSRENGKLGGRPKKEITQETQQVISKPKEPVNSKWLIDNGEMEREKGKKISVESKLVNGNGQNITGNNINTNGESISTYLKREIDSCNSILDTKFSNFPFLKSMANPQGIKELYHHLDDEKILEQVKPVLEKLSDSKFKLRGNYD